MDKLQALHNFWSGFGIKAYDENSVPDDAALPRLTYSVSTAGLDEPVIVTASLWYRDTGWTDITQKSFQIEREIGLHGKMLRYDNGYLWIKRGTPFAQRMADEDDTLRRIYMNLEAEYITAE